MKETQVCMSQIFSVVRPNPPRYEYEKSEQKFHRLKFPGHEDVEWVNPIDAATLEVQYGYIDDFLHQDSRTGGLVARI